MDNLYVETSSYSSYLSNYNYIAIAIAIAAIDYPDVLGTGGT